MKDTSRALSLLAARLLRLLLGLGSGSLGRCASSLLVRASRGRLGFLSGGSRCRCLALTATSGLLGGLSRGLDLLRLVDSGSRSHGLELFSNGILIVSRCLSLSSVLDLRHGDIEVLGVLQRLLIGHVLSQRIAMLVRMNTGIVQTEVVLVGIVPALG
jgi:hypothetical protein